MIQRPEDLGPLYQDYAYAYPHKSAYRALDPPVQLKEAWAREDRARLQMYLHLPFCEMRCGFCNLFTTALPKSARIDGYLDALRREMRATQSAIGEVRPQSLILGGGTPTFIGAQALNALLNDTGRQFGFDPAGVFSAIETSPETATPDIMTALAAWRFDRISLGVQSFIEAESHAMGRPQSTQKVEAALDRIRTETQANLNIDLIYGADIQTPDSFAASIQRALQWAPEEIYIYPLYVRTGVGLARRAQKSTAPVRETVDFDAHRRTLYRHGRDMLRAAGYTQLSLRAFRKTTSPAPPVDEYTCQEDGTIGLGAGARSYTRALHYATDYAVSRGGVLSILDAYAARSEDDFASARHGAHLSEDELQRRYVLKSILRQPGLDLARYRAVFGRDAAHDFPILNELQALGCLALEAGFLAPTEIGLEHADALPPLFYSDTVRTRMKSAVLA